MMRMNKTILILTILCSGFYSQAQVLSLDSIFDKIRSNNPGLKMYDAEIRSMDEAAYGAKSWMPPEVGAGFFMTPYNTKMWRGDGMGSPGMGQFMFSIQQMFPNKSNLDAQSRYMLAMSSVEKERKNHTLNDLFADAKKNYYEWMIDKRKLTILAQDEKLLNFMMESAELRYKNGLGKISAYYKVKASLGNVENMRIMLESEIIQKRILLNMLMNRDKNRSFEIDSFYIIKDYAEISLDSATFSNARSDIRAIEDNIQLNNLKINLERTKLKPEFGIKYDNGVAFGDNPMMFSLMGMVRIPLAPWSSKMSNANIESYKWKSESLNQQKAMIINEAQGMTGAMLADFDAKKKQVGLYENKIIPALKKNYQTMQLGYEQNTEELFMLFDAWETLNMTQLEYLDQLRQLLIIQIELEKLLEIK